MAARIQMDKKYQSNEPKSSLWGGYKVYLQQSRPRFESQSPKMFWRQNIRAIEQSKRFESSVKRQRPYETMKTKADKEFFTNFKFFGLLVQAKIRHNQCDQMPRLFFNILPFPTLKICPIRKFPK